MALKRAASAVLALFATLAFAADAPIIEVGKFSAARSNGDLPDGWEPLTFPRIERHTAYRLVDDGGVVVLRADANASASGLVRKVEIDARRYPSLAWRWKIAHVIAKTDAASKEGDDYPARVYVTFKYDPERVSPLESEKYELARLIYGAYPPHAGLAYVWENRLPIGTIVANAYSDRVRMIVLRSGTAEVGRWVAEERDLYADYKRAFGEEPPPITSIAVMTDTDDTGERATAWYGDIVLRGRQ
jgi:hypothetical protein